MEKEARFFHIPCAYLQSAAKSSCHMDVDGLLPRTLKHTHTLTELLQHLSPETNMVIRIKEVFLDQRSKQGLK